MLLTEWGIISETERDDETGEPLWWNNQIGWVDKSLADEFDDTDKREFNLPIGGRWALFNGVT